MRRPAALLLVLGVALGVTSAGLGSTAPPARAAESVSVTKSGAGAFADLKVTVDRTDSLVNQAVRVSWEGGQPTQPGNGAFNSNYLQIMQCWGDPAAGPDRQQCQYGGRTGDGRGGSFAASRQLEYGESLVDPKETLTAGRFLPFRSVTGTTTTGSRSEFFDGNTTNEIPFAKTRADGTGEEFFEVQTALEAFGLGCGARVAGSDRGRPCFLVVVPRNNQEVDGSRPPDGKIGTSPLSQTNWDQRVVFPLDFERLGEPCTAGQERAVIGQEEVVEAVSRWQPTLCGAGKAFSYNQISDPLARVRVLGDTPGLSIIGEPVDAANVPEDRRLVYAPVALSSITIALLIEQNPSADATAAEQQLQGSRVLDIQLNQRLVAKLLTQSYAFAVPPGAAEVAGNPRALTEDPEFLKLNPEFNSLFYLGVSDLLVPVGQSDAARQVWQWVLSDPTARQFLAGTPDEDGMAVNTNYTGLAAAPEEFPKASTACQPAVEDRPQLCALERKPYAADFHDAARSTGRGDNLARLEFNPVAIPPAWVKSVPPPSGGRAVLAITDAASAARYGLQTASLRNASGEYVKATSGSVLAGLAARGPSPVAGVSLPAPATPVPTAYPLTTVSYAVTAPAKLDRAAGTDYAAFLTYAVGAGQTPGVAVGTLPAGYVPLPEAQRAQTRAAAGRIAAEAGLPITAATPPQTPGGTDTPTGGTDGGTDPDVFPTLADGITVGPDGQLIGPDGTPVNADGTPIAGAAPGTPGAPPQIAGPVDLAANGTTEPVDVGLVRWALLAALVLGALAALVRPALLLFPAFPGRP